jgi:hypothetical protein
MFGALHCEPKQPPLRHVAPAEQIVPQLPQFLLSLERSTQVCWPFSAHTTGVLDGHVQMEPRHVAPTGHTFPQPLQLLGSTLMSVHSVDEHSPLKDPG